MTFADDRGTIVDLIEGVDCVTRIHTVMGAIRGNHYHEHTTQWTFVVKGCLLVADGDEERIVGAGDMVRHEPGIPHAWQALMDTDCLVFTQGPRGKDYESDTIRLDEPLLA